MFFSGLDWVHGCWGATIEGSARPIPHMLACVTWPIPVTLTSVTWQRCLPGFLTVKSPSPHQLWTLGRAHYAQASLKDLLSSILRAERRTTFKQIPDTMSCHVSKSSMLSKYAFLNIRTFYHHTHYTSPYSQ